jgi:SAM-dependent methyltransferase
MSEPQVKQEVRAFYDQIGWRLEETGFYQNARYEDLRPVSREYIRRCHLRVKRYLPAAGVYLLDAGSGPIQYPEYLMYSEGYRYRVCADLSIVALQEARKRTGEHGLFVVADVANLPFKAEAFNGSVSLHTLHHLPLVEQEKAYREVHRVLTADSAAVVVNGWTDSALMRMSQPLVRFLEYIGVRIARARGKEVKQKDEKPALSPDNRTHVKASGTFIEKMDADWMRRELGSWMNFEIRSWRSVSVRFLRAVIYRPLGGSTFLRMLYWLEEQFPHFLGKYGQYPMIVIRKGKLSG